MDIETADRVHVNNTPVALFDSVERIDWEDLPAAAALTQRLIRAFAADKALFKRLLLAVEHDPYLWAKCEEDVVEDKIVLWDDVDKGLRIRLRMSTDHQQQLAHNHRFSFTNLVLRGTYLHRNYIARNGFDENTLPDDVQPVILHEDRAGDCFTIHHNALHSTPFTQLGTISLVLRGNPVKERAPVMFKEARGRQEALEQRRAASARREAGLAEIEPEQADVGTMFWRVGEDRESAERRAERQMTKAKYHYWCEKLEELGII
ncbi:MULTISPECIES: hypothetical protein [Streptomyces]|uniref:Uncharacterized protein n=1 Tax=Streptomyces demainii TaxID=588122 RepID=A0ABT9L7L8_9ACTN|nr:MULTISPECIES: hypothetical protein [Streptomyces]MBW8090873.1 hypothetical protein [Streptomyces hygroscopicus subsp. hygroscopicus]MDP9615742.1 hypothetical protein [Streptomyces demainii]